MGIIQAWACSHKLKVKQGMAHISMHAEAVYYLQIGKLNTRIILFSALCGIVLLLSSCSLTGTSRYQSFSNDIMGGTLTTRPIPSSGCSKRAPFAPGLSKNETTASGGHERTYRIHLPSGYRSSVPQPL